MGYLISENQSAFVKERSIVENSLIVHEMIEGIRKRKTGKKVLAAVKIDMSKAYDRVSWRFLTGGYGTYGLPSDVDKLGNGMRNHCLLLYKSDGVLSEQFQHI
jgi:hypothetical protein